MTAEIADGWLPLYYSPYRQEVYSDQIEHAKPGFEIMQGITVIINDNVEEALVPLKHSLALYIMTPPPPPRWLFSSMRVTHGLRRSRKNSRFVFSG